METWRPIKDFEGFYEVSDLGRIRSIPRRKTSGGMLSLIPHHKGYLCVNLSKNGIRKRKQVAVLVAEAFIPNPLNKPIANHIKGKEKHNNCIDNLEWATIAENTQHAFDTGLIQGHKTRPRDVQGKFL